MGRGAITVHKPHCNSPAVLLLNPVRTADQPIKVILFATEQAWQYYVASGQKKKKKE